MNRMTPIGAARLPAPHIRSKGHRTTSAACRMRSSMVSGNRSSCRRVSRSGFSPRPCLNFTARARLQQVHLPVHGIILFVGPAGTGKTSLARGLASRTAASLNGGLTYIEVDPHALASAAHGKTQQAVAHLLGTVLAEQSSTSPCIVLLDEVETLAADRSKMSMEANPVDVHRATDAVLDPARPARGGLPPPPLSGDQQFRRRDRRGVSVPRRSCGDDRSADTRRLQGHRARHHRTARQGLSQARRVAHCAANREGRRRSPSGSTPGASARRCCPR